MGDQAHLLGSVRFEIEGRTLPPVGIKTAALLVYLAVRRDWVSRSDLVLLLYGDATDERARSNLRQLLYATKDLVPSLQRERSRVRWRPRTDVAEFEAAADRGDASAAARVWRSELAVDLECTGVPGFGHWLEFERVRLWERWRALVLAEADRMADLHRHDRAAAWIRRIVEAEPFDEDAVREYLRALGRAGRTTDARRAYEAFRERLLREMGTEPAAATQTVASEIARSAPLGRRIRASGLPAIPNVVGPIHGREADLQAIDRAFAEGSKFVTLVGMGGSGKTRVALEWARRAGSVGPVAWTDATDVTSPAELVTTIARACGLVAADQFDSAEALAAELDGLDVVLVVDDPAEAAAAAEVADVLLRGAGDLRLLSTRRAPYGCATETTHPIAGLEARAGARVLIDAAARAHVDMPSEPTLTRLAERLSDAVGGLPLALELAAGWLALHPLDRLVALMETSTTRLDILDPDGTGLRAMVDRTIAGLDPALRDGLARVGFFASPFTPDAAATVGVSHAHVLRLVRRGLVRSTSGGRLALHPLVAEAARGILDRTDLSPALRTLHARYFLGELASPGFFDERRPTMLQGLEASIEDLRRAWSTACERSMHDTLDAALGGWTQIHKAATRTRELRETVEAATPDGPELRRARFRRVSLEARMIEERAPDQPLADELESLLVTFERHRAVAECASVHGQRLLLELIRDDFSAAERIGERGLAFADAVGDRGLRGEILGLLAFAAQADRRLDTAERRFRCAIEDAESRRPLAADRARANLALLCIFRGRYQEAIYHVRRCLASVHTSADASYVIRRHHVLGHAFREAGLHEESESVFREQLERIKTAGMRRELREHMRCLAHTHLVRITGMTGRIDEARELLREGMGVSGKDPEARARWLVDSAWIARITGDLERACDVLAQAIGGIDDLRSAGWLDVARLRTRLFSEATLVASAIGHAPIARQRAILALDAAMDSGLEPLVLSVFPSLSEVLHELGHHRVAASLVYQAVDNPLSNSDTRFEARARIRSSSAPGRADGVGSGFAPPSAWLALAREARTLLEPS